MTNHHRTPRLALDAGRSADRWRAGIRFAGQMIFLASLALVTAMLLHIPT